jgi:hypothetical protein
MATAINDRLFLGIIEAKSFLGLSTSYSGVTVEIQEVLASNTYGLTIGTTQVSYTSDSTPTLSEIVAGVVLAITTAAMPGITATNLGSGKYGISGTSAFQLWIDDTQDVVPATSEDSLVASLIIVAKQMADNYCMNWFVVTDDYGRYLDSLGELVDELDDAELADIAVLETTLFPVQFKCIGGGNFWPAYSYSCWRSDNFKRHWFFGVHFGLPCGTCKKHSFALQGLVHAAT